ncbi:MAG: hypothetical protein EBY22_08880, partial [Gammaproteobacteria bacterium]|nr:hypothetical protein [Gammaproteobacteria bacterium]
SQEAQSGETHPLQRFGNPVWLTLRSPRLYGHGPHWHGWHDQDRRALPPQPVSDVDRVNNQQHINKPKNPNRKRASIFLFLYISFLLFYFSNSDYSRSSIAQEPAAQQAAHRQSVATAPAD